MGLCGMSRTFVTGNSLYEKFANDYLTVTLKTIIRILSRRNKKNYDKIRLTIDFPKNEEPIPIDADNCFILSNLI